jgi:UDP-N-acetylglucosamine--N-acetylmuramyl-(pentapeptide) pyrophosphoryl-undecaprenol N-acetylglucosamine transferase
MTKTPANIVIAGGGTGGHLFPAVSIARQFVSENASNRILFVSTGKPIEVTVLEKYGFELRTISAEGLKGRGILGKARAIFSLARGFFQSKRILNSFKPDLVVGMGSYSAAPVVLAARGKKIPVVLCEQNILPGIANRFLSRFADRIYVSFENTGGNLPPEKTRFTGNPVREEILQVERRKKGPDEPFTILVLGGSQGAHRLNTAMVEALETLKDIGNLYFVHQTGEADESFVKSAYDRNEIPAEAKAFFTDMARVYGMADLAVCRAGATTVAELSALAIPAFFVPFPFAADNHQALNAKSLCDAGAAEMVLEKDLTGDLLAEKIVRLTRNPRLLEHMAQNAKSLGRPDAALRIVKDCCELIEKGNEGI